MSKNICRNLKKGSVNVSYTNLSQALMLVDLFENYALCMNDTKRQELFEKLNDLLASCNISVILPPATSEAEGCDENSLITEDLYCIITEDTEDPVVREDIPNVV